MHVAVYRQDVSEGGLLRAFWDLESEFDEHAYFDELNNSPAEVARVLRANMGKQQ